MYVDHPVFKSPSDPDISIWRYIDFAKFVSLVSTSTLHFTPASKMEDKFEGSFSYANLLARKEWYSDFPDNFKEQLGRVTKETREYTYLNCWHMSEYESMAMWGLYQVGGRGVAIKSTFNALKKSLKETKHHIHIGEVQYIDYKRDIIPENNAFYPYVHKRRSFEHERELRAVFSDMEYLQHPIGDYFCNSDIPIDLSILIKAIHIAPGSPAWYLKAVEDVAKAFGLEAPIKQSGLDKDPVY